MNARPRPLPAVETHVSRIYFGRPLPPAVETHVSRFYFGRNIILAVRSASRVACEMPAPGGKNASRDLFRAGNRRLCASVR